MREKMAQANSLGLAGPHIVLVLRHRWRDFLGNLFPKCVCGPSLLPNSGGRVIDQRVSLVIPTILYLSLFRAQGGIRTRHRGQRRQVIVIFGGKRGRQGPGSTTEGRKGRLLILSLLQKALCTGSLFARAVRRRRGQRQSLTRVRRNNVRRCCNHGQSGGGERTGRRSERACTDVGHTAMDLTMDYAPIEQSEVGRATSGPEEGGLHIHTQRPNAQDPGGLRQNGGELLGEPDLSETEFDALTSIDFAIGGVKSLSARVRDDN